MKFCLILSFVLLRTASSFHLKNKAFEIEEEKTLNQEQEIPDKEEILASGEDDARHEEKEATDLVPVPATKENDNMSLKEGNIDNLTGSPRCRNSRFKLIREPASFKKAQKICQRTCSSSLVSIHNLTFNDLIHRTSQGVQQGQVWIGARVTGLGFKKCFSWVDGSKWDFTNWAPGQPKIFGGRCVALCVTDGTWRRVKCWRKLPFACFA
ncbi:proteoglycan 3-like [Antechinus flavipes]|uniref:proteoglycan 3-like n=1 Tax=Antechinus flavipes TaxID=38775 RepID=UPI0022357A23|nr:proteoglycan 3-like [Antechinus flavipes]